MAYNNGIDGKALLDEISKVIDAAANQYHEAGEDAGEEFVQGVVDGIKKHSKDAKSEITKIFEDFNKTTNNFKSRKSISNAEWSRVLGLSKELMKSERYVDSIREKLSDISVTFKGTGKISGIDKILDEFKKGSTIESVLWSEASKNYKKKKPAVRQPKAEVPVVSVDPVPVVKAEEKKREAIGDTTAAIVKQGEVADKTSKKMVNMAHAVRRYNKLMEDLDYDFATTESYYDAGNKVDTKEWTLKDLVKRAKMYLDTYYEEGHSNYELKNENAMGRKVWESETKKLQRFIASYEPYVDVVQTTVGDVQKATAATKKQTDALHDQAAAAEGAAQAQKKLNDARQAGSTKKSLEEDFASQLKALHGWRDLAEKVKEQIRNSDASNTREIRKNVLSALNGVPDDVAALIGDGFVAGLRNGFKGVKTQEILDMIHPIVNEAGKGTFMGAPITEMFELLDGVDLNNFNINDILEQAKQAPVIFKPMLDILQKINDARQSDTGVTDVQTDAMRKQESAAENVAKTIEQQNKVSISSYQDLYEALKKVVELSKQLKPEHTTEYSDMVDVMNKASYPDSKEDLIASIKAQYGNVQRIKASIKNGLSVYKDIDGDGYEATYNIDQNTLKDAENMLHGYIYQAVEYFGYTVADAMNDFDKKRIRTFIEKTINQYLAVSDANDAYQADAEVFNAPIREVMDSITDTIMKMVTDAKNIERVLDVLSEFKDRPEGVNRYTLSAQANYIGSAIGIDTPYDEIRANAKKIESYEELCEIVARYNELQKEAVIFGGTQYAGLDETEEMERQLLRARLEATGGKDVYKLAGFYGFDNIDKLASALGIKKQEAAAASDSMAKDTKTIGKQLLELENITGMTVTEVLSDYDNLDTGIKEKVNLILQSIGLMNDQLEFTFSKSRGGNAKAILGENFVILQKAIEANGEYAENLIGKLQEAQKLGINVAPIMERVFSNVPDESGFLSNNLYKPGYEIQARASGKDIHTNQRAAGAKDLNKALEENRIILSATDEQLIKFINDYIQLDKLGVKIDPNPFNFLYDAEKGFSFIDLSLKRTEEQAKSTQEVFRELATVLANIVGFNALGQDSNLGISSGQVIAKVAEAFERAGLASRSELDQWVKERYDGFGNIYDGYTGKTPNMQQVAESAEQSKKSLQDVLELIDKMSSESGDSDAFNKRNKALIDRANNLTSGADYDQLYSQLIESENKYQKELEETNRINKERESQLEAYTIAASSFLGDSKYDSVTFDDKNKLFENFGNKIMQDGMSASDAMDQLCLSMEKLIQQSKEMPDDIIESFGAEKEHVVETVSQLQKLSSIDLTRIFGSVDLKGFLQSFNIDKEHFSTFRTLFEELMQITNAMANGVDVGNAFDIKMEEITRTIMRLGGQMVDLDDGSYATSMQDFYKHMSKTVIQFNDKIKADYTKDEWKALYGTYKNRLTSDPTKGIASDSLYKELNGLFPSLFPDGVLSQQDQFKLIVEKLDEARQLQANNWKLLQGFETGARDGIQVNVDDMYNKMSSVLFADESAESLKYEANAFKDVEQSAEKAANAKSKFDKANQKVKKGADASANSLDDEADSMARISAASPPDPDNWDTVTQYKEGDNDEPSAIRRSRTFRTDDSDRQIVENLLLNDNGEWETTGSTQTDNYRIVRQEELNALYKDREHCLGNILKYTKEIDRADTEAGRDAAREVLALEQERLATINETINSYGDLVSQHKLDVQDENLVAKTRDHEQQQYIDLTEDDRVEAVNEALQRRQAILNNVAKLEKQRNGASSEQERDAINAIIASEQERARIVSREIDLYNSVNAAQKVQQQDAKLVEKARQQQQQQSIADTKRATKEQAELIGKTYDEYLAAQKNIQKFNLDLSGKDHTDQLVNEQQKMAQAQEKLKDLGVDVAKIGDSDVLTLQQKSKLLEKESKQRQDIHDLIVKASDAERDAQKKSDTKAISSYQNTYDSELKALKSIETVARSFGDDNIGSVLQGQIASYKSIVSELDGLNAKLKETPTLAGDENFTQHYDDVALKAKNARVEIEGIFNESKKLQNIGSLVATSGDDVSQLQDKKVAMAAFANEVFEGKVEIKGFNQEGTQMYATLNRGADAVENITVAFDKASGKLQAFNTGTSRVTDEWKDFKNQAVAGAKNMIGMYVGFQEGVQAVRTGLNYVKEIDLAMTELKKVTDETDESYKQFLEDAGSTSAVIGSTISDFTEATATFARLGYSMEEASSMAETAIIYKNVADGLDTVEESSDSIISTMMAFGIEANDTMSIIDRFNAVGNAFAITSAGIGEALQRSASALFAAGNTIDESIALVTAANSVIQNPEQVGTALKTLSLRIRGVKTELEDAGLETEGMAENTAQLQAKLKALTHGKVDIMLDADTFKSTTQILREMSEAWKDMNDIERASALELIGGKRQANILSSVITNFETVEDVITTSMNSSGSAMAENEKWLDSIEGKTYQFTNALQTMWSNILDSEVVKSFIDFGTDAIQLLDTGAGKVIALVAAIKLASKIKGFSIKGIAQGLSDTIKNITTAQQTLQSLASNPAMKVGKGYDLTNVNAYAQAVSNLTAKQQANLLASQGLNREQIRYALTLNQVDDAAQREALAHVKATTAKKQSASADRALFQEKMAFAAQSLAMEAEATGSATKQAAADFLKANASKAVTAEQMKELISTSNLTAAEKAEALATVQQTTANHGLAASIKAIYAANPVGFWITLVSTVLTLIPAIGQAVDAFTKSAEEIKQEAEEISKAYEEAANEVNNNLKTLGVDGDVSSIEKLEKEFASLTAGVDRYGNNLSLTSDQYERYKELCEQIVDINPYIAKGYDSATEAIGNNAGALSQLIELQKIQQRNAVKELISDSNLETIAGATFADIDKYKKDNPLPYGDTKWDFGVEFKNALSNMEGIDDYGLFKKFTDAYNLGFDWNDYGSSATNHMTFGQDYMDAIIADLRFSNSILSEYFDKEHFDNLLSIAEQYDNNISQYNDKINEFKDSLIDTLLQVPYGEESYDKLDSSSKGFIADWIKNSEIFKIDPNATEDEINAQLESNIKTIQEFVNKFADENVQAAIGALKKIDESSVTAREHLDQVRGAASTIWDAIGGESNTYGVKSKVDIEKMLGVDAEAEIKKWSDAITSIQGYLGDKIDVASQFNYQNMTRQQMSAFLGIDWDAIGAENIKSVNDVWNKIRTAIGQHGGVTKTYSALSESVANYEDILSQTKEVVSDNTAITQEYKDSLLELGITEDDLNECLDENNGLIVKNSKQLNKLVKSAKKNVAENIKLAKSQARLEYYDLYKQMRDFTRGLDYTAEGYAILTDEQRMQIDSLYAEMDAINSAIARFSTLEAQLLGVTNAYTKFADAQTADEDNEYSSQAESMVEAFATALNTGDLGTEAAREAMLGLVPEEVYKNLDTVEEKLDAIAKYFNTGELSKYFSIDFDDDGAVEKVDITRDDLKQFFEAGREKGVFTGNWNHFDLSEDITSLEQFAKAMNITEEVAFALFEALENHDAGNLFDPSNILDKFMSGNIEYQAYNNAKAITELQYQLANGAISAEEYAKKMVGLDGQLAAGAITQDEYKTAVANLKKQLEDGTITQQEYNEAVLGLANQQDKIAEDAYNQATAYYDKSKALEDCNKKLKEYNDLLSDEDGLDKDGNLIDKEQVEKDIEAVSKEIETLMADLELLGEPTEMTISLASDYVQGQIDDVEANIKKLAGSHDISVKIDAKFEEVQNSDFDLSQFGLSKDGNGNWTGVAEFITSMGLNPEDQGTMDAVTEYINLVDKQHTLNLLMGPEATSVLDTLTDIHNTLKDIATKLGADYTLDVKTNLDTSPVQKFLNQPLAKTISVSLKKIGEWFGFADGTAHVGGTAFASGTACKGGSWGAPKTETALVGEVGPELLVRGDRWTTVGENGAEFTQVRKGDIIFNHKQTKQLLENGYVTGRGKLKGGSAFASGTAYAGIYTYDKYRNKEKTAYQGSTVASSLSKAAKDISKASDKLSDDFKEIFDWIEVRIEEITGALDVRGAKLENAVGSKKQNAVVDDMIELNQKLYDNLTAGASKYYEYASMLLAKVPSEYRKAAQDGSIAIESFAGKVGESTLEAIQDYREWVQKGDDATQQAEEVLTEISSLAKQAIDNISQDFENKTSINDNKIDQLEAYNALLETDKGFESEKVYKEIIEANNANIDQLKKQRREMQDELNAQVEAGNIKKYSQDWYDAVNDIAAVDTEIIELTTDTENYQDAINELHWDKFDALIDRLEAVSDEAESLIDILGNKDLVDESGNWTDEGITTLGLYAQQMEAAEVQAKKYQEEIKYLNNNWQALGYTEEEYIEKLNELKDGQYDAIKAYHESKDAIVDLNKERVDAIKEGIEKEIEAYDELIKKKKEELDAEKDLHDFQKSIMEQTKDIADLERQLAALSGDNSASARAKRAQLEAELAKANAELQESYYERSISNQQEALDKELENFQDEKNAEIESWEEYLENTELVVADSLSTIQANTETVYATLQTMGQEYSLSITESLTSPWAEGSNAIQSFSEQFGISMSATVEELESLAIRFKETMLEIEQAGVDATNAVRDNAQEYEAAEYQKPSGNGGSGGGGNSGGSGGSGAAGLVSSLSGYIRYGDRGSNVKKLQQALNELGYGNSGTSGLDGIFGDKTLAAVKKFQKDMGISADGIVGPNTKKKFKAKGYAKGSMGVDADQWALIDELGEELQVVPGKNGRLEYIKKGTGIVPADLTKRLVDLAINPQNMLDQNRPQVNVHPEIHNTQIQIDASVAELIHIDHCDQSTLPDVEKIVNKALDKHMQNLNQSIRKYRR